MKLKRTLSVALTEDQAATLHALGYLHRRSWADQARDAIADWLDAEALDPHVIEAKRAVRLHQAQATTQRSTPRWTTGALYVPTAEWVGLDIDDETKRAWAEQFEDARPPAASGSV